MNKKILKILISTLILLIGIGAVSAIEHNSTDEFLSVEQTDEISAIEDNTEGISISENNTEVLNAENNNTIISISENNTEVLNAENNNTIISISNDDLTTNSSLAIGPEDIQSETQYQTFYIGTAKFLKKYKKMVLYDYKKPSKKNKKAWKKHKDFQKAEKKQIKRLKKPTLKLKNKLKANHWYPYGDLNYKLKYRGKYMYILLYVECYRTYNYDPVTGDSWWD